MFVFARCRFPWRFVCSAVLLSLMAASFHLCTSPILCPLRRGISAKPTIYLPENTASRDSFTDFIFRNLPNLTRITSHLYIERQGVILSINIAKEEWSYVWHTCCCKTFPHIFPFHIPIDGRWVRRDIRGWCICFKLVHFMGFLEWGKIYILYSLTFSPFTFSLMGKMEAECIEGRKLIERPAEWVTSPKYPWWGHQYCWQENISVQRVYFIKIPSSLFYRTHENPCKPWVRSLGLNVTDWLRDLTDVTLADEDTQYKLINIVDRNTSEYITVTLSRYHLQFCILLMTHILHRKTALCPI